MFGKNSLLLPRRSLSCLVFALIGGLLSLFLILQLVFNIFLPWFPPHATVTLIPRSQVAQNTLLLSADHVHARQILATASPQSATGSTAGTIPATNARGTLTFLNQTDVDVTIQSAVITNKNGIQIRFTGPLLIPATTHNASATTTGIAVQAGASGNIPIYDIVTHCCAPHDEVVVENTTAFSGGADAISPVARPLIASQTQQEQAQLTTQMKSNEQVIAGTMGCQPHVKSDVSVGVQTQPEHRPPAC